MAGHSIHLPKYSIGANAASNHRNRLLGSPKSAAEIKSVHDLASGESIPGCARLVVLVPAGEIHETQLAQQVWQLASPGTVPVLMLAIARDYETETALMRRLASLAAFTRDRFVRVDTRIVQTSSWLNALREVLQPGDIILGNIEQQVGKGLFQVQPLCEVLCLSVDAPVYLLSGFVEKAPSRTSGLGHQVLAWGLLPLILAGFAGLDISVVDQVPGSWQQILLIVLLAVEIGAIWLWNTWAG